MSQCFFFITTIFIIRILFIYNYLFFVRSRSAKPLLYSLFAIHLTVRFHKKRALKSDSVLLSTAHAVPHFFTLHYSLFT